jgi:hypothetical protein
VGGARAILRPHVLCCRPRQHVAGAAAIRLRPWRRLSAQRCSWWVVVKGQCNLELGLAKGFVRAPPVHSSPTRPLEPHLAWGFEAGTKMSTFAHRGHRGAPSHALGTHRHQSRFHRHFRGTFGHFRGNFSDFQGQKPENRGKSGTPENNCPTPRFTADCFAWGSRRQKIYGTRRWRDFKIFRI